MARLYQGWALPRPDLIRRIAPRPDPPRTRERPHAAVGLHYWRRPSTALRGRWGYGKEPGRAEPCSAAFRAGQEQPSMARLYQGWALPRPDPIRRIAPRPDPPRTREWPHEAAALHYWRRPSTALRGRRDTAQRQVEPSHARLPFARGRSSRAWLGSTRDARRRDRTRSAASRRDPTRREQENGRTRRSVFVVGAGHPRHIGGRRGFGKKPGRAEPCSAAFRAEQEQPSMARLYQGCAPSSPVPPRRAAPRRVLSHPVPSLPVPPRPSARRTAERPHKAAVLHCIAERISPWRRSPRPGPRTPGCPG